MCAAPTAGPNINEDVVYELMLYLERREQAAAAQVATCWTAPARRVLYRSITFHTWERAPESSEQRLVETLRDHAHLRAFVQQLTIHSAEDKKPITQLDWVDLFPPSSLRNFTYICRPRAAFNHELLKKDAIRTVSHLIATSPDTFPALKACFELPMMETLDLDLTKWSPRRDPGDRPAIEYRLQLDGAKVPNLKHLYIQVPYIRDDTVMVIIAAFAPQLHSLHIHVPPRQAHDFQVKAKAAWTEEFVGHIRRGTKLTRLVFSGFLELVQVPPLLNANGHAQALRINAALERLWHEPLRLRQHLQPFLDEVVQKSAVEHLCGVDGTYSEKLFHRLPRRIKMLEFYVEKSFECEGALLEMLGRVRKVRLGLRVVRFFASEEARTSFGVIEAACTENGVEFDFVPVVAPLYHPPSRPAMLWDEDHRD